jgi:hypothetical protein
MNLNDKIMIIKNKKHELLRNMFIYSLTDINFNWNHLSKVEQKLFNKKVFDELVNELVKKNNTFKIAFGSILDVVIIQEQKYELLKNMFIYSGTQINFDWNWLTATEKKLFNKDVYDELVVEFLKN